MLKKAIKQHLKGRDKLLTPLFVSFAVENDLFTFDDNTIKLTGLIQKQERIERLKDVFHPSGAGACMRGQVLGIMGYEPEREIELTNTLIFDDGKWRHLRWHTILYRMGLSKHIEKLIPTGGLKRTAGTPDQILDLSKPYPWLTGKQIGFEIKGARSNVFNYIVRNNRPLINNFYQVTTYMALKNLDLYIIWYENKDNQEFFEIDITTNKAYHNKLDAILVEDDWMKYIRLRYAYMNATLEQNKLPALECELHKQDNKFRRCPQRKNCVKVTRSKKYKSTRGISDRISIERKYSTENSLENSWLYAETVK